jgi:molybdopterin-guanine dinucleotide biosynthesis protein B
LKAAGIIGFKKSGKTSLLVRLAQELTKRGLIISSVKHSSSELDLPDTDTSLHKQFSSQVAAITPEESAIFFQESIPLDKILNYLKADLILIEGFKREKTFPKIVCLRPEDDPETLLDGLEICIVGESPNIPLDTKAPFLDPKNDIGKIADLVVEKAFKLPDLDCGECGYDTCYEMAKQIVKGLKTVDDCRSLNADVQIMIDGQILPVKSFVSDIVRNTIEGMLSALKGYQKGKIEIKIY